MPNRGAYVLSIVLGALMVVQSTLGLTYPAEYLDADWIKATWFGNDWVTLVVAVPLLSIGLTGRGRESVRRLLAWLGVLGYAVYNYAFYLFGAALNTFFLLYVAATVVATTALIVALSSVDSTRVAHAFRRSTPVRAIGGGLGGVAVGLASIWIFMWAAHVFAGRQLPAETEVFKLVAALDLSVMVPALVSGGALLWRKSRWGYLLAAIAGVQASLYLVVLSINSIIAIRRGLEAAPGQLPIWVPLTTFITLLTLLLFANVDERRKDENSDGAG